MAQEMIKQTFFLGVRPAHADPVITMRGPTSGRRFHRINDNNLFDYENHGLMISPRSKRCVPATMDVAKF
jgi:hypothetical protein